MGAVALSVVLPLSLSTAVAHAAPAAVSGLGAPPLAHDPAVPGRDIAARPVAVPRRHPVATPTVSWPAPGTAQVAVPAAGGPVRAGVLPVWVAPTAARPGATGSAVPRPPGSVRVQLLAAAPARQAGVNGLLLRLARADGLDAAGQVSVALDYSAFRHAFGGDWAARLVLLRLPGCALTTPGRRGCAGQPVAASNDTTRGRVSAEVTAGPAGSGAVYALTAATAGSTGNFTATSLSPSAAWQVSAQSGSFSWSYPLRVPPVPGGLAPKLALSYDSGSVDGATAVTNNQPSAVGQGWELTAGYVERAYKSCTDDGHAGSGDLCWDGDHLTLVLNGRASELVKDATTGAWHPKDDDGSLVEQVIPTTAVNGAWRGEYWRVTTTDGTQYSFGLDELPGWATGKPETKSAWTVPVAGDDSGEPCFNATFASAFCNQAWRWNLDYVADPHGNTVSYYYAKQQNFYDRAGAASGVAYDSGGALAKVVYGTRGTSNYSTAPAQVVLTTANRCRNTCTPLVSNPGPGTHNVDWPDLPSDQVCTSRICTGRLAPTFWTTQQLTTITTQINTGSGYTPVDSWSLGHSFSQPGDATDGVLQLDSITHTGQAPAAGNVVGSPVALPPVTFAYTLLDNRVDGTDSLPPMLKPRIQKIVNETGGELDIAYSPHQCSAASPPTPASNTSRCFPLTWTPPGQPEVHDWFHKYLVTDVTGRDDATDAPLQPTHYDYLGGAAWHFADADEITPVARRSWTDWRGYAHVRVTAGSSPASVTDRYFYRGMDGDRSAAGGVVPPVTVADADGTTYPDSPGLAGFTLQALTWDGSTEIARQTNAPDRQTTATHAVPGTGRTVNAFLVDVGTATTRIRATALPGGSRTTRLTSSYDVHGNVTKIDDQGDLATTDDDRCTQLSYASNAARGMYAYPSQVSTVGVSCGSTAANPIALVRTYYDKSTTLGQLPGAGDATRTDTAAAFSGTTPTAFATTGTAYDAVGRPTQVTDAINRVTKTDYTTAPATVTASGAITQLGLATVTTVTNPLTQTSSTTVEPAWGLPVLALDAGGRRTEQTYDALGRLKEVWLPGRNKPGRYPGNLQFGYTVSNTGATSVSTARLGPNGRYTTGYDLYDGFARLRQTQSPATPPATGRVVTDTLYDARGLAYLTNAPYYNTGVPSGTLLAVLEANVPSQTLTQYDGAGRATAAILYSYGIEQWGTVTGYDGDRSSVTPPAGGSATTTVTDARGRTTELWQYHGTAPTGSASDADVTRYGYARAGQLASITDPAGNGWRYTYDALGRKTIDEDPDRGTSRMTYDNAGQLLTSLDARGRTLRYTYDALGRRTGEYDAPTGGTQLAGWTYDTAPGGVGLPASSTRYVAGKAFTTAVTGYVAGNIGYLPDGFAYGLTVSIPDGPLSGDYSFSMSPKPDGAISNVTVPALAGQEEDSVVYSYDDLGHPKTLDALGGHYVSASAYTERGLPAGYTLGGGATATELTWDYDQATDRLARSTVVVTGQPTASDVHYSYDHAGNLTAAADTPQAGPADNQCFGYDYLRRLTQAWTPDGGNCAAAPTAAGLGGAAPYWTSYGYDLTGNRITQVGHDPAGGPDTTGTYGYPAAGGPQPHTLTSLATAGPGRQGTSTYGYDAAGNTTSRALPGQPGQTLTPDAEGHLATVTAGGATTSYLYDADGNRLLAHDSTGDTLYLPYGTEMHADPGGAVTLRRYYTHNGSTVAVRTVPAGTTGNGTITYLAADPHGTATHAITPAGAVSTRYLDPFGNPRAAPPSWPSNRGFLGAPADPTGLTHLGAREYDPSIGRFTSADPLLDPTDPQSLNGYAYATDNPTTDADPSGLCPPDKCGDGMPKGGSDQIVHYGHSDGGWVKDDLPVPPPPKEGPVQRRIGAVLVTAPDWSTYTNALLDLQERFKARTGYLPNLNCTTMDSDVGSNTGVTCGGSEVMRLMSFAMQMCDQPGIICGPHQSALAATLATGGGLIFGGRGDGGLAGAGARRGSRNPAEDEGADALGSDPATSCLNSFTGDTPVLMADGSEKPISKVGIGDKVVATDPETGQTAAEPVEALIRHGGTHHMVRISLDDGSVLVATDGHPIWDATTGRFTGAANLKVGDHVRALGGQLLSVIFLTDYNDNLTAYNLQVQVVHTYFVGSASILVHNSCGMIGEGGAKVVSLTLTPPRSDYRIDVENPSPGVRAGQLHLQTRGGEKYMYDFDRGVFMGLPNSLAKKVTKDPAVARAIRQGLNILGLS